MDEPTESKVLTPFGAILRGLRRDRHVTHRQIATAAGIAVQTSSNCEIMPHKVVKRDRVERIAAFYGLTVPERDRLLAAWEELPQSAYNARQATSWTRRNQVRSKARHHDAMQVALVEVLAVYLELAATVQADVADGSSVCTCDPGDPFADAAPPRVCEICAALSVLGYPGKFNGLEPVIAFLASLQETLTAPTAEASCR